MVGLLNRSVRPDGYNEREYDGVLFETVLKQDAGTETVHERNVQSAALIAR